MEKDRKFTLSFEAESLSFAQKCLKETLKNHFKDTGKMDFKTYDKNEIDSFLRLVIVTVAHNLLQEMVIKTYKEDDNVPY